MYHKNTHCAFPNIIYNVYMAFQLYLHPRMGISHEVYEASQLDIYKHYIKVILISSWVMLPFFIQGVRAFWFEMPMTVHIS